MGINMFMVVDSGCLWDGSSPIAVTSTMGRYGGKHEIGSLFTCVPSNMV